jgi:hypothetical protein
MEVDSTPGFLVHDVARVLKKRFDVAGSEREPDPSM